MKPNTNLKSGQACWVRTLRERQQQVIAEWNRIGVSVPRFAETISVKYQSFATWSRNYGWESCCVGSGDTAALARNGACRAIDALHGLITDSQGSCPLDDKHHRTATY